MQPERDNRLVPYYDEESQLIVVQRPTREKSRYHVNFDNVLIFDTSPGGLVMDYDLMIKKQLWRVKDPFPPKPRPSRSADLALTRETIAHKQFDAEATERIKVETNQERTAVQFFIYPPGPHTQPVELSERCIAYVDDDRLIGFYLEFVPGPPPYLR